MAHRKAAAFPAHINPADVVDAIDRIDCYASAFKVIEDLVTPQMHGTTENLSHVNRAGFGWLLFILNSSLQDQINAAKALADEVYEYQQRGSL